MRGIWPTLILGLGTYLSRASFILIVGSRSVPPRLERALRNVGPAVLASLVGALMVGEAGGSGLSFSPELVALAVAIVVAWRTRNMTWTLFAGMLAVWILGWVWV